MSFRLLLPGTLIIAIAAGPSAAAEPQAAAGDWPAWRGSHSDGVARQSSFPPTWPSGPLAPLWQSTTADGWSSPVVAAGRVFITDRTDDAERVAAFEAATGKPLWQQTNPVDFMPHQVGRRHGAGPKGTPVVSEGRVYTLGIAGWLQCLKTDDGAVVWKVNLPATFGDPRPLPGNAPFVDREDAVIVPIADGVGAAVPLFGYTGSPTIDGDLLIVPVGGKHGGTIMAFDKLSGRVAWKALSENVSYSSPIVAELGGVRQVVALTGPRVVGLEASSGRLLWSFDYQNQYDESIGTPVVAGDLVLVTAVGRPLSAHRPVAKDGEFTVAEVWTNDDLSSYLSSMLAFDGYVYGMNDGGEWYCLRLEDGREMWHGGRHGYYCTPALADRKLICLNEQGELLVIAADPTAYTPLAANRLTTESTWTSPAVVGNRLYIRSRSTLACFEIR